MPIINPDPLPVRDDHAAPRNLTLREKVQVNECLTRTNDPTLIAFKLKIPEAAIRAYLGRDRR